MGLPEEDRTDVRRSFRLFDILNDMLGTWVGLIDSERILVGLKDGSVDRDVLNDGRDLCFAETDGASPGTRVGNTDNNSCHVGLHGACQKQRQSK